MDRITNALLGLKALFADASLFVTQTAPDSVFFWLALFFLVVGVILTLFHTRSTKNLKHIFRFSQVDSFRQISEKNHEGVHELSYTRHKVFYAIIRICMVLALLNIIVIALFLIIGAQQ